MISSHTAGGRKRQCYKNVVLCAWVGMVCLLVGVSMVVKDRGRLHRMVVEEGGTRFVVSVFNFDQAMRIPILYNPGDLKKELSRYSWLGPALFTWNGFEEPIPKEKWRDFFEFEWDDKTYSHYLERCRSRKRAVQVDHVDFWTGITYELETLVCCSTDGASYLVILPLVRDGKGKSEASEYIRLKKIDGRWKRFADISDSGGVFGLKLLKCYKTAMKAVESGELGTNPIRRLK